MLIVAKLVKIHKILSIHINISINNLIIFNQGTEAEFAPPKMTRIFIISIMLKEPKYYQYKYNNLSIQGAEFLQFC